MKTKLSRVGKSSLSMILSLMMIFSTMLIGTITTANATISYWTVTAGFNDWNKDDPNYKIDGSSGSVTYDTNNSSDTIYFRMVAHEDGNSIQNSLNKNKDGAISANSEKTLIWGTSEEHCITFTPSKRYVKFSIRSANQKNYLTVTESDTASGGGATLATPEIEVSNGGVITSGGNVTVSVKNTSAYPADAGVTFELYKDGTKTSQSGTGPFTVTESGSYTVKAVPTDTVNYKESNLSSSVTVASQETSAFQLCEGSSFTSLGSFTKLGDKYSITLTFTKGTHKLSVYNTEEVKHYLNSNAGTLTVEGDVAKLYKYNNYTDANKNDLAEFNAERDGEYTFAFTEDTTTQRTDDWNLKLVKVPDAVKYKVTPDTTGVANLDSMTITDSSDVVNTEFAADSVVKVKLTASDKAYKPGGLIIKKGDGSDASVNVSSNGDGIFSFNMPEYDVTVTPIITQKAYYDVTFNYDSTIGTVTSSSHTITDNKIAHVMEGTIVDLTATGIGDYNFAGWGISGATVTEGTVNNAKSKSVLTVQQLSRQCLLTVHSQLLVQMVIPFQQ